MDEGDMNQVKYDQIMNLTLKRAENVGLTKDEIIDVVHFVALAIIIQLFVPEMHKNLCRMLTDILAEGMKGEVLIFRVRTGNAVDMSGPDPIFYL